MSKSPEFNFPLEAAKERLRQERETFDLLKSNQALWFRIQVTVIIVAIPVLLVILVVAIYIIINHAAFPEIVIASAAAAVFGEVVSVILGVWKVALNPNFVAKLAPTTKLDDESAKILERSAPQNNQDLTILFAQYGAQNQWKNVTNLLQSKVKDGKLSIKATNDEMGGDPIINVVKSLSITFRHEGKTITKSIPENEELSIP